MMVCMQIMDIRSIYNDPLLYTDHWLNISYRLFLTYMGR